MPGYQYRVIGTDGKEKKGSLVAANTEQAAERLKADGYIVVKLTEDIISEKALKRYVSGKITIEDYYMLCRQYVTISSLGVSTVQTLQMLVEQVENRTLRKSILLLLEDMGKGDSLFQAMKKQDKIYSSMFLCLAEAGEAEGNYKKTFEGMAAYYKRKEKISMVMKKTMIYPAIIAGVSFCMLFAMMILVIPNFMIMFSDMNIEMTAATKMVVLISEFLTKTWWLFVLAILLLVILLKLFAKTAGGRYYFSRHKMRAPLLGNLRIKSYAMQLFGTLSILLQAGIPMTQALEVAADMMEDNVIYKQTFLHAREQVEAGDALSKPLISCNLFEPIVIHMVSLGEETGKMSDMLDEITELYEEDIIRQAEHIAALMEPLLILLMALLVGALILAVMQPMLALYNAVGMM